MDQFTYGYGTTSNRLLNVADAAGATSNPDDIESGQVANNYQYDLLGQLTKDNQEGIVNYNWRLSDRKLRSITGAPTKADVNFIYNPFGQRVVKIVKPKVNGVVDKQSNWIYTYYSYDANGQVMAVYDCKLDPTNTTLNKATLKEQHLYGSQRLGMVNKNTLLYQSNTAYTAISSLVQNTYGNTNYELNNHLGNVNAVITDRRFWNTTTLKYEADVEMKNDYYPFGMAMKGRQLTPDYRYGYNGMEIDNEISGNGNSYTTEFRQYDPRLGRWKSLDPLDHKFPNLSPYNAFRNNPIFFIDKEGEEPTPYEAAQLAKHVYGGKDAETADIGRWKESSHIVNDLKLKGDVSGLKAKLYEAVKPDGTVEYALVYAGTEGQVGDVAADIAQVFGLSIQYFQAAQNVKKLKEDHFFDDVEFTFVGHSLGGGLAHFSGLLFNRASIGLNPAGVSHLTELFYGTIFKDNRLQKSYINKGEILDETQKKLIPFGIQQSAPKGNIKYIDAAGNIFKKHSIDAMIKGMSKDMDYWNDYYKANPSPYDDGIYDENDNNIPKDAA